MFTVIWQPQRLPSHYTGAPFTWPPLPPAEPQVAAVLADSYEQVIACDASQAQLRHATQRPNIRYLQAPAEQLPEVAPGSVDLACAAQCFHW